MVQMIIVVMRDDHGVDDRQVADRNGILDREGTAKDGDRRGPVKHGIGHDDKTVQLHEQGCMPQPDKFAFCQVLRMENL